MCQRHRHSNADSQLPPLDTQSTSSRPTPAPQSACAKYPKPSHVRLVREQRSELVHLPCAQLAATQLWCVATRGTTRRVLRVGSQGLFQLGIARCGFRGFSAGFTRDGAHNRARSVAPCTGARQHCWPVGREPSSDALFLEIVAHSPMAIDMFGMSRIRMCSHEMARTDMSYV